MVYRLKYSKKAAKEISKLDNLVKRRIKAAIENKLAVDPIAYSSKLTGFAIKEIRRFRVGKYRVIFVLTNEAIEVLRVGHRREIYK